MPRDEIPEETLDECTELLYDKLDDTTYTQQASADAWSYIASVAGERAATIRKEMGE